MLEHRFWCYSDLGGFCLQGSLRVEYGRVRLLQDLPLDKRKVEVLEKASSVRVEWKTSRKEVVVSLRRIFTGALVFVLTMQPIALSSASPSPPIRVLVLYDQPSTTTFGGEASVQERWFTAIERSNQVMSNSNLSGFEYELTCIGRIPAGILSKIGRYDMSAKLRAFENSKKVAEMRADCHASLVVLSVRDPGLINKVWVVALSGHQATKPSSFSDPRLGYLVMVTGVTQNYTFDHEVGHILGGAHGDGSAAEGRSKTKTTWSSFANGYKTMIAGKLTGDIMSVGTELRVPVFSSPTIAFSDVPMGIADKADMRKLFMVNWARLVALADQPYNP